MALKLCRKFDTASSRGLKFDDALNSVARLAYRSAESHVSYVMMLNNWLAVQVSYLQCSGYL
jgi:hypothetical protein